MATPSAPAAEVPLVDGRVLAVGLGFIGGIAVLNFFTGGMGTPMLAAGGAAEGTLFAAGRAAGGRLITASSGVLGGLVGDYLYRWNGATPAPANP